MNSSNDREPKLGWNLAAGVASTAWTAIVTIATVPVYLHFLGVEAYGLIGFYIALQAMLAVLDLGLAQSINREVARSSQLDERIAVRNLLHTLAAGYWLIAILIGTGMWLLSPWIASTWLVSNINPSQLSMVVAIMGLTIALRFPLGLYLGALIGARRLALASGIEIAMVTLANFGVVAILAFISQTIEAFFIWQAAIAALNVLLVRGAVWRTLAISDAKQRRFDIAGLKRIWKFSAGVAVTALLGAIFVQSDKLVLSKFVTLADLGRYTLAWIAARSLYVLTAPAFNVVYPQLSALHAAGATLEIERLYRFGTRLLMTIIFPAAFFVAAFSTPIFTIWTGDAELARSVFWVVTLLMVGTAFNCAMHFPYALQLSFGKSSLPMLINGVLLCAFVPLLIMLSQRFGILGGAMAWASLNTLYLFFGTWITHRKLLRGTGLRWLASDVGLPFLSSLVLVGGGAYALFSAGLPDLVGAAIGVALPLAAFLIVFRLTPGLATFTRQIFALGPNPKNAEA